MEQAKHTPGPWEIDTVDNEGEYGNRGPDTRCGFKSFAVIDADGHHLFDSLNRDGAVTEVHEEYGDDFLYAWDEPAKRDMTLAAAAPELLAALAGLLEIEEERIRLGFFTPNASGAQRMEAARAAIAKATS